METIISANHELIERLENYILGANYGRQHIAPKNKTAGVV